MIEMRAFILKEGDLAKGVGLEVTGLERWQWVEQECHIKHSYLYFLSTMERGLRHMIGTYKHVCYWVVQVTCMTTVSKQWRVSTQEGSSSFWSAVYALHFAFTAQSLHLRAQWLYISGVYTTPDQTPAGWAVGFVCLRRVVPLVVVLQSAVGGGWSGEGQQKSVKRLGLLIAIECSNMCNESTHTHSHTHTHTHTKPQKAHIKGMLG